MLGHHWWLISYCLHSIFSKWLPKYDTAKNGAVTNANIVNLFNKKNIRIEIVNNNIQNHGHLKLITFIFHLFKVIISS